MSESRTKKASRNVVLNFSNQLLTLLLTFVSRTFFIRAFGVEYLGLNGIFTDVLGMLSVADLGFNTAMIFSLYKPLASHNEKKIAQYITFYRKIYYIIATAVAIIGISLIPALPYLIKTKNPIENLWLYYLFALANVVVSYLCIYKTAILSADQKGYVISLTTMCTGVVGTISQILSIIFFPSYLVFLALGALKTILANLIASRIASKTYPYISQRIELEVSEKRSIFKNIGAAFVYKISSVLLSGTTNVVISVMLGTAVVGYYSNYFLLQNQIMLFYSSIFAAITASIGNLIATESPDRRRQVFDSEQSLSFIFSGVVTPCYILLCNDFIRLWLGADYVLSMSIVVAVGLNLYLSCIFQPLWSYRDATGMYQRTKWVMASCAVINLLLSLTLGSKIGLFGIVIAGAISRLATYAWFEPLVLFKVYFKKSPKRYYLQNILNFGLIVILVVVLGIVFTQIQVNTWVGLILKAVAVALVCLLISVLAYSRTDGWKLLLKKVRSIIK